MNLNLIIFLKAQQKLIKKEILMMRLLLVLEKYEQIIEIILTYIRKRKKRNLQPFLANMS